MLSNIKQLKKFLYNIKNNNINQIHIKSKKFGMIINKHTNVYKNNNYNKNIITIDKNMNHLKLDKQINNTTEENNKIILNASETYSTIISPMVGTFYRSPAPNEIPFIEKNDIVEKKQTVCIIEAMKLMNEIEAEVNGEIVEILVKDGDIVDCGQALMKVKNT